MRSRAGRFAAGCSPDPHHGDGAARFGHHLRRHAAQVAPQPGGAARTHHHLVDLVALREVDDRRRGVGASMTWKVSRPSSSLSACGSAGPVLQPDQLLDVCCARRDRPVHPCRCARCASRSCTPASRRARTGRCCTVRAGARATGRGVLDIHRRHHDGLRSSCSAIVAASRTGSGAEREEPTLERRSVPLLLQALGRAVSVICIGS